MSEQSNNLPAIPISSTESGGVTPQFTGQYIMADTERDIRIAPVPEAAAKLLEQSGKPQKKKVAEIVGIGTTGGLVSMGSYMYAALEPSPGAWILTATLYLTTMGYMWGKASSHDRLHREQQQTAVQALQKESAVTLPAWQISLDLSRDVLAREITFPAENGITSLSAESLLATIGEKSPGMELHHPSEENEKLQGKISPAQLVKESLRWVGKERENLFLQQSYPYLQAIHSAAKKLPPFGLTPDTPESLRQPFEEAATQLISGTLGVYAVMRVHAGQRVAEEIRGFYAQQEKEYSAVLSDALLLDQPTVNKVSWRTIENFHHHLRGEPTQ